MKKFIAVCDECDVIIDNINDCFGYYDWMKDIWINVCIECYKRDMEKYGYMR